MKRFQEAEVIHCRWAMLGAAGCLAVEALGFGNWYDAPLWVSDSIGATLMVLHGALHRFDRMHCASWW
jgi:light-harvesting complex I chlorophyll a/b binding protein 1